MSIWSPNPLDGFSSKPYFLCLVNPSPMGESISSLIWRLKIPRKMRFFTWQVLHGCISMPDRLVKKMPSLVWLFCCILFRKVEEDLDHILWYCDFAKRV